MNKKIIIGIVLAVILIASVVGLTLTNVVIDKDTETKLVEDASENSITADEQIAKIAKSHYDAIEQAEIRKEIRLLESTLLYKVETLVSIKDPELMQEVIDDIDAKIEAKFNQDIK